MSRLSTAAQNATGMALFGLLILAVLIALPVALAEAQTPAAKTGIISEKVIEQGSSTGLPGVTVFLRGTTLGAMTDPDGHFEIRNVPPGTYPVLATMVGYDSLMISSLIVAAGRLKADIDYRFCLLQLSSDRLTKSPLFTLS